MFTDRRSGKAGFIGALKTHLRRFFNTEYAVTADVDNPIVSVDISAVSRTVTLSSKARTVSIS